MKWHDHHDSSSLQVQKKPVYIYVSNSFEGGIIAEVKTLGACGDLPANFRTARRPSPCTFLTCKILKEIARTYSESLKAGGNDQENWNALKCCPLPNHPNIPKQATAAGFLSPSVASPESLLPEQLGQLQDVSGVEVLSPSFDGTGERHWSRSRSGGGNSERQHQHLSQHPNFQSQGLVSQC